MGEVTALMAGLALTCRIAPIMSNVIAPIQMIIMRFRRVITPSYDKIIR